MKLELGWVAKRAGSGFDQAARLINTPNLDMDLIFKDIIKQN